MVLNLFHQITSFVQNSLVPSLGQGSVSGSGPYSAASLLAAFRNQQLDPKIYENALKILNLSDDLSPAKIEEQRQFLSTFLKNTRKFVSAPESPIFDRMISDIEIAYQTVMAGPPRSVPRHAICPADCSSSCKALITVGPIAGKRLGLLKAISEPPQYTLLRTPADISAMVKKYFPHAEVYPDVHNGYLLGVTITKISSVQPPLFVHSALDAETFSKILKQLQEQIALGQARFCEVHYPVDVSSFSAMLPLEEKGFATG